MNVGSVQIVLPNGMHEKHTKEVKYKESYRNASDIVVQR